MRENNIFPRGAALNCIHRGTAWYNGTMVHGVCVLFENLANKKQFSAFLLSLNLFSVTKQSTGSRLIVLSQGYGGRRKNLPLLHKTGWNYRSLNQ